MSNYFFTMLVSGKKVFIDYRLKGCMNWENKKNNITGSKK
jgi:hypothetical protein